MGSSTWDWRRSMAWVSLERTLRAGCAPLDSSLSKYKATNFCACSRTHTRAFSLLPAAIPLTLHDLFKLAKVDSYNTDGIIKIRKMSIMFRFLEILSR
jgi:hypothetical protein